MTAAQAKALLRRKAFHWPPPINYVYWPQRRIPLKRDALAKLLEQLRERQRERKF